VSDVTRDDGLTDQEGMVADALCRAVLAWQLLSAQHPDEEREFVDAVHTIQNLLAIRVARRCYPKGWPTYDS
jgi:hypothetical protein